MNTDERPAPPVYIVYDERSDGTLRPLETFVCPHQARAYAETLAAAGSIVHVDLLARDEVL